MKIPKILYETVVTGCMLPDVLKVEFRGETHEIECICMDDFGSSDMATRLKARSQFSLSMIDTGYPVMFLSIQTRMKLHFCGIDPVFLEDDWQMKPSSLIAYGWNDVILNPDMIVMPFGGIKASPLVPDEFFIRPDSGDKRFPGQVSSKADHNLFRETYKLTPDVPCIVASPKRVWRETRVWLDMTDTRKVRNDVGSAIMGMCGYAHDGEKPDPLPRRDIVDFLEQHQEKFQSGFLPDVYVADFCATQGLVKLVEVNSVSTSGLYGHTDVISHVVRCAMSVFNNVDD